jgi:hypothetical protein
LLGHQKGSTTVVHDQRDHLGIERFERAACEPAALLAAGTERG